MRLIDADPFEVLSLKGASEEFAEGASYVLKLLDKAHTVDAVPVVHASWVDRWGGKYANPHYECSNCKKSAPYKCERDVLGKSQWVQDLTDLSYYCPNCGAKMDGERRNNDG